MDHKLILYPNYVRQCSKCKISVWQSNYESKERGYRNLTCSALDPSILEYITFNPDSKYDLRYMSNLFTCKDKEVYGVYVIPNKDRDPNKHIKFGIKQIFCPFNDDEANVWDILK